ncbi:MAG: hypothetical protein NVS2B2_36450 [Ktedonobacteraceae bacterium]
MGHYHCDNGPCACLFLLHTSENDNYLNFAERPVVLQEYKAEEHSRFIT